MPPLTMLRFSIQSFLKTGQMRNLPSPLLSNSVRRHINTPPAVPECHLSTTAASVQSTSHVHPSHRGRSILRRVQGRSAPVPSYHQLEERLSQQLEKRIVQLREQDDAWYKRTDNLQSKIQEKCSRITTLTVEYHFPIFLIISNF